MERFRNSDIGLGSAHYGPLKDYIGQHTNEVTEGILYHRTLLIGSDVERGCGGVAPSPPAFEKVRRRCRNYDEIFVISSELEEKKLLSSKFVDDYAVNRRDFC